GVPCTPFHMAVKAPDILPRRNQPAHMTGGRPTAATPRRVDARLIYPNVRRKGISGVNLIGQQLCLAREGGQSVFRPRLEWGLNACRARRSAHSSFENQII